MKGSRQFLAELSELEEIFKWVREVLTQASDLKKLNQFEIAIEEAVVNVINYAYGEDTPGVIDISFEKTEDAFHFFIKDQGVPFNPLENTKSLDVNAPLEKRDIGGLGIHFILNMTDAATYRRVDGWNVLTLTKLS